MYFDKKVQKFTALGICMIALSGCNSTTQTIQKFNPIPHIQNAVPQQKAQTSMPVEAFEPKPAGDAVSEGITQAAPKTNTMQGTRTSTRATNDLDDITLDPFDFNGDEFFTHSNEHYQPAKAREVAVPEDDAEKEDVLYRTGRN